MSSSLFPAERVPPQLRLFHAPAEGEPQFSADFTLTEFYQAYVRPVCLVHAAERNLKQYEESLGYWAEFTGDPPLRLIDDYTAALFLQEVKKLPGRGKRPLADNTVRKHCVHVQFVIDRAGPRSRHNPQGKRLIDEVPLLQKPSLVIDEVSDNFTIPEIGAWLEACDGAIAPALRGCSPADFWRALVLFTYNAGFRLQTLLALRWEWIYELQIGKTETWIQVPPAAIKKKRGRPFYLTRGALEALELVRPVQADGRIFPWPHCEGYLQQQRREILSHSSITPSRHFGFHGLRKALSTELTAVCRGNDCAASMALGHSQRNTTRDHYLNPRVMAEAMDLLPQPKWTAPADPQLKLF
ncbi:MAG TPA: tyrosine-type recombinase/integrase [Pirellulales bacterium]|nr:tyrosine-type recombinase/integrase [Pirellulales bacterium]